MRAGGAFLEPGASPRHDAEDGPFFFATLDFV